MFLSYLSTSLKCFFVSRLSASSLVRAIVISFILKTIFISSASQSFLMNPYLTSSYKLSSLLPIVFLRSLIWDSSNFASPVRPPSFSTCYFGYAAISLLILVIASLFSCAFPSSISIFYPVSMSILCSPLIWSVSYWSILIFLWTLSTSADLSYCVLLSLSMTFCMAVNCSWFLT
jgi:hypothetical protein